MASLPFQFEQDPSERLDPIDPTSTEARVPFQYTGSLVPTAPPVDLPVAEERAKKWDLGLGSDSPGKEALITAIGTGTDADQEKMYARIGAQQEAIIKRQTMDRYITGKQGKFTSEDVLTIDEMGKQIKAFEQNRPIVQDYFAYKYSERATNSMFEWWTHTRTPTEADFQAMDYVQRQLYIKESIQKFAEGLKKEYDAKGIVGERGKISENAERFVPLLYDARLRSEFFGLTGNDLVKQYGRILNLDNPEEAISEAKRLGRSIFDKNHSAGLDFLHGLLSYSSSDALFDNAMSVIDWASIPGLTYAARQLRSLTKASIKATGNRTTDFIQVIEASGDIETASRALAVRQAKQVAEIQADPEIAARTYQSLKDKTISLQQGSEALEGPTYQGSRERARRLEELRQDGLARLDANILSPGTRVSRLEAESNALQIGGKEADDIINRRYPNMSNNILDVRTSNIDDGLTNNYFRLYQIGQKHQKEIPGAVETGVQIQTRMSKDDVILVPANERGTIYIGPPAAETTIFDLKAGNDNIQTIMGDPYLRPFESREVAEYAAKDFYQMKPGDYAITPKGIGWVIETRQSIPETALAVRNELKIETRASNPSGWGRFFSSILPISKDTKLASELMESAKLVGYSHKNQQEFVRSFLAPIDDLRTGTKKSWNEFKDFIEEQRHFKKDGEYGRFSRSLGEFEQDWMTKYGRLPTDAEHTAYWAYVQLSDVDWVIRNLVIYKDKVRDGRNMFTLETTGETGKTYTAEIEGKSIKTLPFDSDVSFNYALWNIDPKSISIYRSDRPVRGEKAFHARMREDIESGKLRVIHLAEYSEKELRDQLGIDLPKGRINYIVTDKFKSADLPFQQIPYRPGGHRIYDYAWYARQPIVEMTTGGIRKTTWYRGDLNHMGFESEVVGREYIRRFNEARILLNNGDEPGMASYVSKNLPYSPEHFKRFFKQGKGELSSDVEVRLTKAGENVDSRYKLEDVYKTTDPNHKFVRTSESPHNMNNGQINLALAQERNDLLPYVDARGRGSNMQLNFNQGKFLDPMISVHYSADNIANARNLDDLKIKATERFIAEFSDGLAWDINRLRADPLRALVEAPIKAGPGTTDYWAIMDARRATLELLGIRTPVQKGIDTIQQKIYETLNRGIGKKIGENTPQVVADWLLWTIKDPTRAIRTAAFHLKQGLFAPASFFNQFQAVVGMSAIEGATAPGNIVRAAISGKQMALLDHWNTNPKMIEHFAQKQTRFGIANKDHFIEMHEGLRESGYGKVGRETADYADWLSSSTDRTSGALNWALTPFKAGEGVGRYMSYSLAYQRWRDANPDKLFDSSAKTEVLNRADFLNLNMSGVSNTILQKGIPGVVTQFFTAHLRQAEQIIGRKLSAQELASLLTVNSLIYGLPVGLSPIIAAGLWPVRQQQLQGQAMKSFDPTDHVGYNIAINGLMSVALEKAAGLQYDTGSLGLGGISMIKDLYENQKPWYETLSGVSGRTFAGVVKSFYPFEQFILSTGARELRREDFQDILSNISSFSAGEKIFYGIAAGKYYGRNEQRLDNITGPQAVISALLGVQPQSMAQMSAEITQGKNIEGIQKKFEERYSLYIRRAFEAADKGDDEGFHSNFSRANLEFKAGNFPETRRTQMLARAIQDNQALADRVHKGFSDKLNSPTKIDDYIKYLKKRGLE